MKKIILLLSLLLFNNSVMSEDISQSKKIKTVVIKNSILKIVESSGLTEKEFVNQLYFGIGNYNANQNQLELNKTLVGLNLLLQIKNDAFNAYYLTGCLFTNNVLVILPYNERCKTVKEANNDKTFEVNTVSL